MRAVYLTPGHQFPTTVVLRPSARLRLRALAAQFGFIVIEDDYDHEFQFDHQPMFPLASDDHAGQIIYVGSFSKVLSPSLRVGYVAGPRSRLIEQIGNWIGAIDRQGDPITELAIVELIESGPIAPSHQARPCHFRQSGAWLSPMPCSAELGDLARFEMPTGGLAFWVRFAEDSGSRQTGTALAGRRAAIPDEHAMRDQRQGQARRAARLRQLRRTRDADDDREVEGCGGGEIIHSHLS